MAIASLTASASVEIIGWCGKTMITVDEGYFEEDADCGDCPESAEYYQSLVEEMCGPGHNGDYTIRRN